MKDKRPVNLDVASFQLPLTAYASILHRVSGAFLFVGVAVLIWLLDSSLASEESFNATKAIMSGFFAKLILWAVLSGLIYHTAAGVKHLIMDAGIGETMEGGIMGAKAVFVVSAVLILLTGAWIW